MYRTDDGSVTHSPNNVKVRSELFRQCGYCMNCRLAKAQSWAIRMVHEAKFHAQNSFLTLTYNDSSCPSNGSLRYDDVTNFIKRLRRRLDSTIYKNSLTFYRVGEYGDIGSRPHYHMVLFGFDFTEPLTYKGVKNTCSVSSSNGDRSYYKSSFATDLWTHGFVDIGNVDYRAAMYVAKYVTKKLTGPQSSLYGDLLPEKASMSKRRPIGTSWIEKYYSDVYPHDYVVMDGKRLQPPKFYDLWLEKNVPSLWSVVKQRREDSHDDSFPDPQSLYASQFIRVQKQSSFLRDGCAPNFYSDKAQLERKLSQIYELTEFERNL